MLFADLSQSKEVTQVLIERPAEDSDNNVTITFLKIR